jgi:hypothetical protein
LEWNPDGRLSQAADYPKRALGLLGVDRADLA